MEQKKNESHDLEKKRPLFFNIGLVVALTATIAAFNWKGQIEGITIDVPTDEFELYYEVPVTKIPETEPPKPASTQPPEPKINSLPNVIEVDELPESIQEEATLDLDNDPNMELDVMIMDGPPIEIVDEPLIFVETMPSFPGGIKAFYQYVSENITYPRAARNLQVSGKVFIQFVIDKDGSISDVKVVKGLGLGCDDAAAEVLENSPKWNPGKQRGRPVRVRMVLPISFVLN